MQTTEAVLTKTAQGYWWPLVWRLKKLCWKLYSITIKSNIASVLIEQNKKSCNLRFIRINMMFTFLLKTKIIFKVLHFWWKCIYTKDNWYADTNWVKQKVFKSLIWKLVCFRKKVSNIVTISELCVKCYEFPVSEASKKYTVQKMWQKYTVYPKIVTIQENWVLISSSPQEWDQPNYPH